jgi:hypothetical protein
MPTIDQILREREFEAAKLTDPDRYRAVGESLPLPTDGGATPWAQTRAGVEFQAEQDQALLGVQGTNAAALARQQQADALELQEADQEFQAAELDRRLAAEAAVRAEEREAERQANIAQLKAERQAYFGELMKSGDQVRAVIFALGYGPDNDAFDVRARNLGTSVKELKGAKALRRTTQTALSRVLDRDVTIGKKGVRGLGTAISSARAFIQGGADVQTLLTSAFGVGSLKKGEQPGMSAERLAELIQEVTPQGVL